MSRRRGERRHLAAPALWTVLLVFATLTGCGGSARPVVVPAPATDSLVRLKHQIDGLIADPALPHATWGIAVRSIDTGDVIYRAGDDKLLLPASTMKLVTLAAAAERLGWNFTFQTQLLGVGAIDFGYLDGDLVVVGSGDPSIDDWDGAGAALFRTWADRLKALGVRTIGGRIIGDDNAFDDQGLGEGWAWDDLGASFAASAGALQFNQNTARVAITPAAAASNPPTLAIIPPYSPILLRSTIATVPAEFPTAVAARRLPGSKVVELAGAVPAAGPQLFRNVSVDNPTEYFVTALRNALIDNGIEVRGDAVDIDAIPDPPARADGVALVVHRSAPLSSLAETMMKSSQNMYAETLLRTLGAVSNDAAVSATASAGRDSSVSMLIGTADAGRAVVRDTLESWEIGADEVLVADGSGLSRYNLATADALTRVLVRMAGDEAKFAPFAASLPIAGRDGTLRGRLVGTAAEGRVRAKTGSFSNARALAGYATTADGARLAFAIIANNFADAAPLVDRTTDAIVLRLVSDVITPR